MRCVAFAATAAQADELRKFGDEPGTRGLPYVDSRGLDAVALVTLNMIIRGQDPTDTTAFRKVFASQFRGVDKPHSVHPLPPDIAASFADGRAVACADAWRRTHEPAPLDGVSIGRWFREMNLLAVRAQSDGAALFIWLGA